MSPPDASPSVAVVGARAVRQGIGGHLARFFAALGCPLVGVAGTSEATATLAATEVARTTGQRPRPYADVAAMLVQERPRILVIASPHDTHERYLRMALAARVHVLCEKPLCWGGSDPVAAAESLARSYREVGLVLAVNCQWPYTLDAYRTLHPGVLDHRPRTFHMRLSPRSHGPRMLPDCLPHALSLLQAVLPDPEAVVAGTEVRAAAGTGEALEIRFRYVTSGGPTEATVVMAPVDRAPRPASYGFDGAEARREVDLDGYRMRLEAEGRSVPLPDPTPRLVAAFLRRVEERRACDVDPAAIPGMRHLAALCAVGERA